jgi:hypothetical protein
VAEQIDPEDRVLALTQSSQGGTTIPVDANFQPTYNAISWMDGRGEVEQTHIGATFGAERLYRVTGWKLMPALPLPTMAANCPGRSSIAMGHFERLHRLASDRILGMSRRMPALPLFDIALGLG